MSYIALLTTETGALLHLTSPTGNSYQGKVQAACPTRGAFTEIGYGADRPPLPLCERCVSRWRHWIEFEAQWTAERLDSLIGGST